MSECLIFAHLDECWKPNQNPFKQDKVEDKILCRLHFKCKRCSIETPDCLFVENNYSKGYWVCFDCLTSEEKAIFLENNPDFKFKFKQKRLC